MAASDLLNALKAILSSAKSLGYDNQSAAHDIYEAYILGILVEAAAEAGWRWELRDGANMPTTRAVFRKAPGRLCSGDFTHLWLSKAGRQDLEAHLGVKVIGHANVAHEFDLLLLTSAVATMCRAHQVDPRFNCVLAHAEAKYHGANLALPIGRAMVGLAQDCSLAGKSTLVTNRNGVSVERLIQAYQLDFRFLITPGNARGLYHLRAAFKARLATTP